MMWLMTARQYGGAAAAALAVAGVSSLARPASAQEIERVLAGVRLGSKATNVLARYGNPNQVVIGDIGIRAVGGAGTTGGTPGAGGDGAPTDAAGGPGLPGPSGGPGFPSGGKRGSGPGMMGMASPGGGSGYGGPPSYAGGPSGGGPPNFPGAPGGGSGYGGPPNYGSSYGGSGGGPGFSPPAGSFPGAPGGAGGEEGVSGTPGGGVSGFGNTISTLAREQEVTWIYNRKVGNNLVSYEFLIGPNGDVSQIRVSGYSGGNAKTKRGIVLGSTYKDVVRAYGYAEEHAQVGPVLIASYRKGAHVQFQFLNQKGQTSPLNSGNKVVAITIATVE